MSKTTQTQTLAAWILAHVEADEAAVLNHWDSDGRARVATMWTGGQPGYTTVASDHADGHWVADGHEVKDPRHVRVLFDPARVLAQCAAIKAVVALGPSQCGGYGEPVDPDPEMRTYHYPHPDYAGWCDGCSAAEAADATWKQALTALAGIWGGQEGKEAGT